MESMRAGITTGPDGVEGVEEGLQTLCGPGIEPFITSELVLTLLGIPAQGLLRISAALLFAGNDELCAYWWRDAQSGQQHAELRDPVHVRNAFANSVIDTGYLPANTLRMGLGHGVCWLAVFVPPASYRLTLLDEQEQPQQITLNLPGCILAGRGTSYWLWAVKERVVTPATPLFHMPLPNIGGDGTLCFGVNAVPRAEGATIMQAFHLFLESPFNDHWALGKARSHSGDVRTLLRALASSRDPVFPEEELLPLVAEGASRHTLTLDHLLHRVLKGR